MGLLADFWSFSPAPFNKGKGVQNKENGRGKLCGMGCSPGSPVVSFPDAELHGLY